MRDIKTTPVLQSLDGSKKFTLDEVAQFIATQGKGTDNQLAFINPKERELLIKHGGSGNPHPAFPSINMYLEGETGGVGDTGSSNSASGNSSGTGSGESNGGSSSTSSDTTSSETADADKSKDTTSSLGLASLSIDGKAVSNAATAVAEAISNALSPEKDKAPVSDETAMDAIPDSRTAISRAIDNAMTEGKKDTIAADISPIAVDFGPLGVITRDDISRAGTKAVSAAIGLMSPVNPSTMSALSNIASFAGPAISDTLGAVFGTPGDAPAVSNEVSHSDNGNVDKTTQDSAQTQKNNGLQSSMPSLEETIKRLDLGIQQEAANRPYNFFNSSGLANFVKNRITIGSSGLLSENNPILKSVKPTKLM